MFPLSEKIDLFQGSLSVDYQDVLTHILPLLTEPRQKKISQVVQDRCFDISVVLESIYDRGNISAVMRSAEGLGFGQFHVVETFEKFKEANRVTQGADKWLEVKKWKSTKDCIRHLKDNNIRICVTSLEASKPLQEIDFTNLGSTTTLNTTLQGKTGTSGTEYINLMKWYQGYDISSLTSTNTPTEARQRLGVVYVRKI